MKVKDLLNELKFYNENMEVYIQFEGEEELLSCGISKTRLSKNFPVGFMLEVEKEEFNDMFKEAKK